MTELTRMFLLGLVTGGALVAVSVGCLMVLGAGRRAEELREAEDRGFEQGYARGKRCGARGMSMMMGLVPEKVDSEEEVRV